MKKLLLIFLTHQLFHCSLCMGNGMDPRGRWRITALTPQVLMLTGDYSDFLKQMYRRRLAERKRTLLRPLADWAREYEFHIIGTEAILRFRPDLVRKLAAGGHRVLNEDGGELKVSGSGYWLNPAGLARFEDEQRREWSSRNADVVHYLFLMLEKPLREQEKLRIRLSTGEDVSFTYSAAVPSMLFKINQLGYRPDAGRKYAYLGAWLGTAGPLDLKSVDSFELVEKKSGRTVCRGPVRPRMKDPVTGEGTPFTGEKVFEMDFSEVKTSGSYFLRIPSLGRSEEFEIGSNGMAEAFYIHARGLYHKRCGIAKTKPFTHWQVPACHIRVVRGNFPPHAEHYGRGQDRIGFFDRFGRKIAVNHFQLISAELQNLPAGRETVELRGGWHDAADCDRRPAHLSIVGDLTAVYLLKPENFCDGQLNLPESGNGIPDILDEACWGLEHLRQSQSSDGGVGTWIETSRHPTEKDGLPSDEKLTYVLSRSTRNSTLEYCAYAAELALALRRAGAADKAELFARSAVKAWDFAVNPANIRTSIHRLSKGHSAQMIFYHEARSLAPEFTVKAGAALYLLTGEKNYLHRAAEQIPSALDAMKKQGWKWSPFFWMPIEMHARELSALEELRQTAGKWIVEQADRMLRQLEEAYPYRIPWFAPGSGWEHTMSWGTCHPLRRARMLVAAHALTGDRKYLDGALLANDYHNGANPNGMTMTSGLGRVYPVRFLDLTSYRDGIGEFVPGITPFRHTYGIAPADVRMAHGLFYPPRRSQGFPGCALSLLPAAGLTEKECARQLNRIWPVWRRWANLEQYSVPDSEYTVWETIGPAAAVTGYLLERAELPRTEWIDRKPVSDIRQLPGYTPLP